MFACKFPIYRGLRHLSELYSFLLFEKIVNDCCRFQREMLPLGEFLKINLDIRVEQVVFDLPRCLQRISK